MPNKAPYVSLLELERVVGSQEGHTHCERDSAILYLTYYTGLRVGEVSALVWSDLVDPATRELLRVIKIRRSTTKGHKQREVYLVNERARAALRRHMANSSIVMDEPVFQSQKGGAFSPGSLKRAVAIAYRRGHVKASSHSGRRSFATNLLEAGGTITDVKELLGHACITTTQKYLITSPARLERVCNLMA